MQVPEQPVVLQLHVLDNAVDLAVDNALAGLTVHELLICWHVDNLVDSTGICVVDLSSVAPWLPALFKFRCRHSDARCCRCGGCHRHHCRSAHAEYGLLLVMLKVHVSEECCACSSRVSSIAMRCAQASCAMTSLM